MTTASALQPLAGGSRYYDVYARAMRDPEGVWSEAAAAIDWYEPPKQIFDKSAGKYIFKKSMSSALPDGILNRKKMGFAIPLGRWFRNELKDVTYSTLFDSTDGILDPAFLKKIWSQHQRGHYDRSQHLWAVLMFGKWKASFGA